MIYKYKYNKFNYLNSILYNRNLIESSAGTGKTNIVSLLFLRFLFKINIEKYFLNLELNNILIVTFTDLATLEIKNRILENIRLLKLSCIKKICIDDKIIDIFNHIKNIHNIVDILTQFEYQIDLISVFTIHSFCKKILFNNFIECNINYNTNIIENEDYLIYELVILFWYKKLSCLSIKIFKIILSYWSNPLILFKDIKLILNFNNFNFNIKFKYKNVNYCYKEIINFINVIKYEWKLNNKEIYIYFNKLKIKNLDKIFNEINIWSNIKTVEFYIPKNLFKLKNKYINFTDNYCKLNHFFDNIKILLLKVKDLYNFILILCVKFIFKKLNFIKNYKNLISFNDLTNKILNLINLNKKFELLNLIRKNYPIILIDEFQDIDYTQFDIFNKIYINNFSKLQTKLIFIGDIKQSIYSFRGSNIFNYINIKQNMDVIYTFNLNWRSSYYFNKGLNYLFNKIKNPFGFSFIKYKKLISYNKNLYIKKKKKNDYSFKFFVFNKFKSLNKRKYLAKYCALKIIKLLYTKNKDIFIYNKNRIKRNILPSDLCILVYKNFEIEIILEVFNKYNLPIVSNKINKSIYSSLEAKDLILIIKAILFSSCKSNLVNALLTPIFNYNIYIVNKLINNIKNINILIKKFYLYYKIWKKYGIYSMINFLIKENKLNFRYFSNKKKYINNLLHLAEILQKISYEFKNFENLLLWLENKVVNINNFDKFNNLDSIRSFNNQNDSIYLSTIHKSKGLQFNIVWLPFLIILNKHKRLIFYHDRKENVLNIDLYKNIKCKKLMEDELKSEEIRLLYVAITRSIYQCNLFLYNISNNCDDFYKTSIGKIICKNKIYKFKELLYLMNIFKEKNIFNIKFINIDNFFNENKFINYKFSKKTKNKINFYKKKNNICYKRIFNYSKLTKFLNKKDNINNNINIFKNLINYNDINYFVDLPKGKNFGNFIHYVLEHINFNENLNFTFLLSKLKKFNINKKFIYIIKNLILSFLNVKLNNLNIRLCDLNVNCLLKEFDFYLYINKILNINVYNSIIKKYDYISKNCNDLKFNYKLYGYINGVIDLIFIYNNKYYIIDYKTNFIGNYYYDYNNNNLFKFMCKNRYDIQYQIYALALHKYLVLKSTNYNYKNNFGGIYYIFLKGLLLNTNCISYTGIYYVKPKLKLINKLNNFFKK